MSNQYETLRADCVRIINEECVKHAEDKSYVAYTWAIGKVFSEIEKQLLKGEKLPESLKQIVRFEFNKLKDKVTSADGFEHKRTRIAPAFSGGSILHRRNDTFEKTTLTLEEQLEGARVLADKAGKSVSSAKNAESKLRAEKRVKMLLKEINYLQDAIKVRNEVCETARTESLTPVSA